MRRLIKDGDAVVGRVRISWVKAGRTSVCILLGLCGVFLGDWRAVAVGGLVAMLSMYIGVVAYHRLMIHRSFKCPRWVEYGLVFLANFSGMGGPISLLRIHERRDWAQRKPDCHSYFAHRKPLLIDGVEQLFCVLELDNEPVFHYEIIHDKFYRHMERIWMLYQIPLGLVLYACGGIAWVLTGVFMKMLAVQAGHWLVSYFLHNWGDCPSRNKEAGTQGYNIPALALISFGESFHNNHHRCPEAASVSFEKGQLDPAWWLILLLEKCHLAHDVILYGESRGREAM